MWILEGQKDSNKIPEVIMSKQGIDTQNRLETERQTKHLGFPWKWVEGSIWTDNMLMALVNGVKGKKWFSLIDKVQKMRTLEKAWHKVKDNRGAAGVDRITVERFQSRADKYLKELEEELKEGRYCPRAVKRVFIPKEGGKKRPLGIPTVKDRVVQTALKMVIEPIFEREFLSTSYGFRPGKSAKDALREVDKLLREGYTWVVDADLRSYFDTIPPDRLMEDIKARISDGRILALIEAYLKQDICEEMRTWTPVAGTPQGAVISPLLANIYLHPLDQLMHKEGFKIIRFADGTPVPA